ncbi:Lipopolysaccharide core biosynthesis protein RfaG [Gimesia fumaroli]|uniref:Lipopolysaccharide core biosynthesis protein RfaG n=2 Tax=Gimesia fumaroli TaxID=2527976 RepID=A0A518IKZ7_9PLAN|nr:Lipopolysaccharide core biosynthesis protein RfaG [Gimesia fumaroli]
MLSVLARLHGQSFEFTAFCPAESLLAAQLSEQNIECHPVSFLDRAGQRLSREDVAAQLLPTLQVGGFDLLHANSLSMSRLTGALAPRWPVPCSGHLRDIMKLSKTTIRDLNQNQRLVAVSEATRTFHIAQGLAAERVTFCYNGVDVESFQPRPATGALKQELGLSNDARLCLTIGQLGLRKGQDILAEAAALLAAEGDQSTHFVLVGERHSQKQESIDYDRAITSAFEQPRLKGRLHRLGYREDIAWLMNEADLLVHPAKQEPLGRVLLEAIASGLPIVATDVGGTAEIVTHEKSALLVPPGDSGALATAIGRALKDSGFSRNLATAARARALECFTQEQASERLSVFWNDVLL